MKNKYFAPTTSKTSFNCPHCGALAKQFWYDSHADKLDKDRIPMIWTEEMAASHFKDIENEKQREDFERYTRKLSLGRPFLGDRKTTYTDNSIQNLFISQCYNCDMISVWIYNKLVWPLLGEATSPNEDLPEEILRDYEEAGTILDLSPRGAAALLRLCIQKLCEHLGESGKNINDDIAGLVEKGLDVRVQQSLDVVRVIGNEAVHPGQIDLRDDRATAERLFGLLNLVADIMISQPKHVQEMYDGLPENKKAAIERRDKAKK